MKHYRFIDGLRALAVLPVILFHFGVLGVSGGFIGVDVFFVISGFLITGVLLNRAADSKLSALVDFYERRTRRILPALFVACGLSAVLALALFMPRDFKNFSKSLIGASLFWSNFTFAKYTGYFAPAAATQPLLHTWSLAVEEQFYILFPWFLWLLHAWKDKIRISVLPIGIYALAAASLVANLALVHAYPAQTFFLLPTRMWELLLGAIIALHYRELRISVAAAEIISALAVAVFALCCVGYSRDTVFPGVAAVPPVVAAALLILVNTEQETCVGRALSSEIAVGIGLISYGLYLFHWPFLVFAEYFLGRALHPIEAALAIAAAFALAVLSYKYIETPIRQRTAPALIGRRNLFGFSAAGLVLMAGIGLIGASTNGLPQRFDGQILKYASGADDRYEGGKGCIDLSPDRVSGKTMCKIGNTAKAQPDFLLWGDSHANALVPAVAALAAEHKMLGWQATYDGCAPLFGLDRLDDPKRFPCATWNDAVLKLLQQGKIKKVLLAARWDVYALGREKDGIETLPDPKLRYRLFSGETLMGEGAFEAALWGTIETLTRMGIEVTIVEPLPSFLMDVPSTLAEAVYFRRNVHTVDRPYQEVLNRLFPVDVMFMRLFVRGKPLRLQLINPIPKFCMNNGIPPSCRASIDGHALFSDNNHITIYGALWAKSFLKPFFAEN